MYLDFFDKPPPENGVQSFLRSLIPQRSPRGSEARRVETKRGGRWGIGGGALPQTGVRVGGRGWKAPELAPSGGRGNGPRGAKPTSKRGPALQQEKYKPFNQPYQIKRGSETFRNVMHIWVVWESGTRGWPEMRTLMTMLF